MNTCYQVWDDDEDEYICTPVPPKVEKKKKARPIQPVENYVFRLKSSVQPHSYEVVLDLNGNVKETKTDSATPVASTSAAGKKREEPETNPVPGKRPRFLCRIPTALLKGKGPNPRKETPDMSGRSNKGTVRHNTLISCLFPSSGSP